MYAQRSARETIFFMGKRESGPFFYDAALRLLHQCSTHSAGLLRLQYDVQHSMEEDKGIKRYKMSHEEDTAMEIDSSSKGDSDAPHAELSEERLERIRNDPAELDVFIQQCKDKEAEMRSNREFTDLLLQISRLHGMAMLYKKLVLEKQQPVRSPVQRLVEPDYNIKDLPLAHGFDLDRLRERLLDLFQWHDDQKTKEKYMAPYIPIVQSSGSGKTKVMYELRKLFDDSGEYHCAMILCSSDTSKKSDVFTDIIDFDAAARERTEFTKRYMGVKEWLDCLIKGLVQPRTVLLFDEAQALLSENGFLFRCIRWWLRKIDSKRKTKVVALFTGTTSQLANYYRDPPESKYSRDADDRSYEVKGTALYPPFFDFCTVGCLKPKFSSSLNKYESEYHQAIPYGRPLFAAMQLKNKLDDRMLSTVLQRMLLSTGENYFSDRKACLSVLATRVQMGQTSFRVASDLVAKAYATLTDFTMAEDVGEVAQFCYLPDPVCARLAMCLMDENWENNDGSIKGMSKKLWTSKMIEIFSMGICRPPKGDVGEVVAACYLLLCGDVLRRMEDNDYKQFSVSLSKWVSFLLDPDKEKEFDEDLLPGATISFIQVCRNYIRYSGESTKSMMNESFLEYLYKSGCAFFVYPGCPTIDLFAAIRLQQDGNKGVHYVPLLVSVKARAKFSSSDAEKLRTNMAKMLADAGSQRGLCLVVLVGGPEKANFPEDYIDLGNLGNLKSGVVFKVVQLSNRVNPFGLAGGVEVVASDGMEIAETYASHTFLQAHINTDLKNKSILRSVPRKLPVSSDQPMLYVTKLREALSESVKAADTSVPT